MVFSLEENVYLHFNSERGTQCLTERIKLFTRKKGKKRKRKKKKRMGFLSNLNTNILETTILDKHRRNQVAKWYSN